MNPFICDKKASLAIISYKANKKVLDMLKSLDIDYILTKKHDKLPSQVDDHPDMMIHPIDYNTLIIEKSVFNYYKSLKDYGKNIIKSYRILDFKYPKDIYLNVSRVGDYYFHKENYIDENLKKQLDKINAKEILVKQGYSRCSTMVIGENTVITQDLKLHKKYISLGLKSYLLPPGGITLPGYDTGFIGGTCGMINRRELIFYGDIDNYIHGDILKKILKENNIGYNCPKNIEFFDRGSIITI